ncbi:MAG: hypothetical protein P4L91_08690 [Burkholderiaceae bacterium]|nr:hypothetical protein [Burkholderiaceae bacterium]
MKILKFIKTAALVMLLCAAAAQPALAIRTGSTGSSAGFKSGFSSHKYSAPSHSADRVAGKSTSFGSFGAGGNASSSTTAGRSALSRDLSSTAANSAALKTFDARNRPAAAPAATPSYAPNYAPSASAGYVTPPLFARYPQTVIVQRDSGFFSSPWLWFMLGHSMGDHERVVYERPVYANSGALDVPVGAAASGVSPAPVPAAEPAQESFGARALRVVLWLAIIGALSAAVIYLLARRASRAAAAATVAATHYSLGKI